MARRHEDHQPVALTAFYGFKTVADQFVVAGWDVEVVGVFSEAEEGCARFPALQLLR